MHNIISVNEPEGALRNNCNDLVSLNDDINRQLDVWLTGFISYSKVPLNGLVEKSSISVRARVPENRFIIASKNAGRLWIVPSVLAEFTTRRGEGSDEQIEHIWNRPYVG